MTRAKWAPLSLGFAAAATIGAAGCVDAPVASRLAPPTVGAGSSDPVYAVTSAMGAAVDAVRSPTNPRISPDGRRIYGQCLRREASGGAETPCPSALLILVQSGDVEIGRTLTDARGEFAFLDLSPIGD